VFAAAGTMTAAIAAVIAKGDLPGPLEGVLCLALLALAGAVACHIGVSDRLAVERLRMERNASPAASSPRERPLELRGTPVSGIAASIA
jgi:hypothetical protein